MWGEVRGICRLWASSEYRKNCIYRRKNGRTGACMILKWDESLKIVFFVTLTDSGRALHKSRSESFNMRELHPIQRNSMPIRPIPPLSDRCKRFSRHYYKIKSPSTSHPTRTAIQSKPKRDLGLTQILQGLSPGHII